MIKKQSPKYYYDIIQRSEEWFKVRKGKLTASNAQQIASNGRGLETLCYGIIAEKVAIKREESYINEDIKRGIELEQEALNRYSFESLETVESVGFVELNNLVGCSPDGLIGKVGGVEVKCPNDQNFIKIVLENKIDSKYVWQCQMNLLITKRRWWDLVFYNPNFKKNLIIFRQYPEKEKQNKLKTGIKKGKKILKGFEKSLNKFLLSPIKK
jgi:putative phage-type endonuclease